MFQDFIFIKYIFVNIYLVRDFSHFLFIYWENGKAKSTISPKLSKALRTDKSRHKISILWTQESHSNQGGHRLQSVLNQQSFWFHWLMFLELHFFIVRCIELFVKLTFKHLFLSDTDRQKWATLQIKKKCTLL